MAPGQPGVLPNLETGTAQITRELSHSGLQPKKTLPVTGAFGHPQAHQKPATCDNDDWDEDWNDPK